MIKFVLLVGVVLAVGNTKPGKTKSLPDPVIPTVYQKSKFFYGAGEKKTKGIDDNDNEFETVKCKNDSSGSFIEQTLIGVGGKRKKPVNLQD